MSTHRKPAAMVAVLLTGLLLSITGCRKETSGGVPLTPVDFQINVNNPAYNDLAVPGGWLYLTGGSLGIIVYRKSMEEFVALDRHCPYQPAELCRVHVDGTDVIARDTTCCGSAYLIMDGSVTQGPASLGLQRYNTAFNGSILRIYN